MDPVDYTEWVDKFRALIADSGLFAEKQLIEYVEGKTRRHLTERERWELRDVAIMSGAVKQKFDGLVNAHDPCMYRFPVKRRRGLVGRKQDNHTVDFFTRSTGSEDDAAERKRKASMQVKKGARGGR